jgi:hypothetical protein
MVNRAGHPESSQDALFFISAIIAAGPGNPADYTFYEEFLSWKRPVFL